MTENAPFALCQRRKVAKEAPPISNSPDIDYASNGRAHEIGNPRQPLESDFEHASRKFTAYLSAQPGWTGVLAVDLGFCCSPTIPEAGKVGRNIPMTTADLDTHFAAHRDVAALLLTWVAVEIEESEQPKVSQFVPKLISGLRYSPKHSKPLKVLDLTFRPWVERPERIAIRRLSPVGDETPK